MEKDSNYIALLEQTVDSLVRELKSCGHPRSWSTQALLLTLPYYEGWTVENLGFLPDTKLTPR